MEIRALRESDDRSQFRSGDADLDRFFQAYAGQNQFRHHVGTTYVAAEAEQVLGYLTVAPGSLEVDRLPGDARRRLPRYPLPVLRIARLAVAESVAGQGLGKALLKFGLELALRMAEDFGCAGVVVDAKPGAVAFYERFGFMTLDVIEGAAESRPQPAVLFLAIAEIRAAQRG